MKKVLCVLLIFLADSLNVYNKNTMLKPTAIPTIIIQRVRFGKLDYPEIITNLHSDEKQKVDDMEDTACSPSIISNPPMVFKPEMIGVECLKLSSSNSKISNANDIPVSKSISNSSNFFNNKSSTKVNREFFVEASVVEDNDIPKR